MAWTTWPWASSSKVTEGDVLASKVEGWKVPSPQLQLYIPVSAAVGRNLRLAEFAASVFRSRDLNSGRTLGGTQDAGKGPIMESCH